MVGIQTQHLKSIASEFFLVHRCLTLCQVLVLEMSITCERDLLHALNNLTHGWPGCWILAQALVNQIPEVIWKVQLLV